MRWLPWLLLLVASAGAGEAPEARLRSLGERFFPARGVAAVPRLGDWIPDAERDARRGWWRDWQELQELRAKRPGWPLDDGLRARWHLVDGAIRGSAIHGIDAWLTLLPGIRDRIDLARLLAADGRCSEAAGLLGTMTRAQLLADSQRLERWREAWACLLDLQAAAIAWPGPVLDPPVVAVPAWDERFATWLGRRIVPPAAIAVARWGLADHAEPTAGGEAEFRVEDNRLVLAPLRPGHLRWSWRAIAPVAGDAAFDRRWLDLPVLAEGASTEPSAVLPVIPGGVPDLLATATLDDGSTIAWAVVHVVPRRVQAWCDGGFLAVAVAEEGRDGLVPCPAAVITVAGQVVGGGHREGPLWIRSLADLPPGCTIDVTVGDASCRVTRPTPPPAELRLAAWWSRPDHDPGRDLVLAGCLRLGDGRIPRPPPGAPAPLAMALMGEGGQEPIDLGAVAVDEAGCFIIAMDEALSGRHPVGLVVAGQTFRLPTLHIREARRGLPDAMLIASERHGDPPAVRWQPTARPAPDPSWWQHLARQCTAGPEGPLAALLRSDGSTLEVEPWPRDWATVPDAPEGQAQWRAIGFSQGQWQGGRTVSAVRPTASELACDLVADGRRVIVRVTDQDRRAVAGARVAVRVVDADIRSSDVPDMDAYAALFGNASPGCDSACSRVAARIATGVVWRRLRSSAVVDRQPPAGGTRTITVPPPVIRGWGRCGGCRRADRDFGVSSDPLALWQAWLTTSADGVITLPMAWPRPAPSGLTVMAVVIADDAVGQATGTLIGDWTAPD